MKLTARYHFAASHRLVSPALTQEENARLYGKCNYPFGHGHDYVLDVTVEGPRDESGQVILRDALNEWVGQRVIRQLDHLNLNTDVAELGGKVTTTENLAFAVEKMLAAGWPHKARLAAVRISETARNTFELQTSELQTSGVQTSELQTSELG
ncbi:MAG: 6-carboxytetrahydropterin synthase [Bryobacteraceae bacterium]